MRAESWVAALVAVFLLGSASAAAAASAEVGKAAPEFSAIDENGAQHRLADYKGKIVVLEWTNPGCPYVQRHYRQNTMEQLSARYTGDGVAWLAVNSTHDNTPEDTRAWRDEQGFSYATLQDASGDLGRAYKARTTPHMYVIDGQGVLQYDGAIDDSPRGRKDNANNYVDGALQSVKAGATPDPSQTRPYGCSVKYK